MKWTGENNVLDFRYFIHRLDRWKFNPHLANDVFMSTSFVQFVAGILRDSEIRALDQLVYEG